MTHYPLVLGKTNLILKYIYTYKNIATIEFLRIVGSSSLSEYYRPAYSHGAVVNTRK